ncbi:hypothetical protein B0T37_03475 [Chromobacterium violaceum]|uniref:Uncharacterized protein n=1 Tax=Chromobacterium violaceum TaxID=536 RepID=A0A202BC22_CHRVL|nr:hypothetical protein B0T38_03815 [Chromobacterium violaceum]OQS29044.1 hypothetical protein B0T37_03475 [Chromobacterium violaceum]OVE49106.1 hypothetical protein CBW21_07815 [Chromobacterium violaceum]
MSLPAQPGCQRVAAVIQGLSQAFSVPDQDDGAQISKSRFHEVMIRMWFANGLFPVSDMALKHGMARFDQGYGLIDINDIGK